jgi:uncharacterized membrane protein (UPF0127 family)
MRDPIFDKKSFGKRNSAKRNFAKSKVCRMAAAWILAWAVLTSSFAVLLSARAEAAEFQTLEIVTRQGVQVFAIEFAATEEERATGLMYRRELPEGRGMLFDFSPQREVAMWMKNTYISLDMIFIRADGRIHRIAENTEPESTRLIQSQGPVKAVLEVAAGTTRRLVIAPGDKVGHPLFDGSRGR